MAAHIVWCEPKVGESDLLDSTFDSVIDLQGCDLRGLPWSNIIGADSCIMICCICHDMGNSSGKRFDGAIYGVGAVVTDTLASFSIFLIGDAKSGMSCGEELSTRGSVGDDGVISSAKDDVFNSKSLSAGALFWSFICVLSYP